MTNNKQCLFIAIDLPNEIRKTIHKQIQLDKKQVPELYDHNDMIDEANWHITVLFLGEQSKTMIDIIKQTMHEIITSIAIPQITLNTLTTTPLNSPPHMIWVNTDIATNNILSKLKATLEQALAKQNILAKGTTYPIFKGHVTIAYLPKERSFSDHAIKLPKNISFTPKSIDLMESRRERGKVIYARLYSVDCKTAV